MPHAAQFLNERFNSASADKQDAIGKPANNVLCELFVGEQLLREHGVLRLHKRDIAMQFDGDAGLRFFNHELTQSVSRDALVERGQGAMSALRCASRLTYATASARRSAPSRML